MTASFSAVAMRASLLVWSAGVPGPTKKEPRRRARDSGTPQGRTRSRWPALVARISRSLRSSSMVSTTTGGQWSWATIRAAAPAGQNGDGGPWPSAGGARATAGGGTAGGLLRDLQRADLVLRRGLDGDVIAPPRVGDVQRSLAGLRRGLHRALVLVDHERRRGLLGLLGGHRGALLVAGLLGLVLERLAHLLLGQLDLVGDLAVLDLGHLRVHVARALDRGEGVPQVDHRLHRGGHLLFLRVLGLGVGLDPGLALLGDLGRGGLEVVRAVDQPDVEVLTAGLAGDAGRL